VFNYGSSASHGSLIVSSTSSGVYLLGTGSTLTLRKKGGTAPAYTYEVAGGTVTVNANAPVNATESLLVTSTGKLTVATGVTLAVNGTVNVTGTIEIVSTDGSTYGITFGAEGSAVVSTAGTLVANISGTKSVIIGSGGLLQIASGTITVKSRGANIYGLGKLFFAGNVTLSHKASVPGIAEDITLESGILTLGSGNTAILGVLKIESNASMIGTLSEPSILRFGSRSPEGKAIFYTTTDTESAAAGNRNYIYTWKANAGGTGNAGWVKTGSQP
jgi:hypothetical protein